MNAELFNIYVEKLINEITELMKTKILLSAQVTLYEKMNAELNNRVEELEKALHKAAGKSKKDTTSEF